jgi:hypothetical protein
MGKYDFDKAVKVAWQRLNKVIQLRYANYNEMVWFTNISV